MTTFRERPGIRVVRVLERDAHTEALLVRLGLREPHPAVLLRALDDVGARMRRRELAALDRARGDGVIRVLDVVGDDTAPAALVERLAGPRLAAVVADRQVWRAGEAVTVLAPLADAIGRLHDAGVAHGAVSAARLVLSDRGPVLDGLLHAELFAPGSPEVVRERLPGVAADREAVRELAALLLARVDGPRSAAARELGALVGAASGARVLEELAQGLSELAAATPLGIAKREGPAPREDAAPRLVPVVREPARIDDRPDTPVRFALGARVPALVAGVRARLDALPAARRRLAVGGGAALAVASVMLAVLPSGSDGRADAGPEPLAQTQRAAPETQPTADAQRTAEPESAADAGSAAIAGDDPLAAAVALLDRRERCLAELSFLCLEEVDQAGSAALADDRRAVTALREGREAEPSGVEPVDAQLVERLGDSALVRVGPETAPASLLLVRSEAGWRIRDWVAVA
ncbi:hypothetical protein H4J02_07875 [Protaetiibacter sp. SSC-01]|uniref:hypothetical protein n=1 Tax=Protaetiibacter sp. SSC-01 TaxID=2759943 RepID=UPI001656AC69|nr:hypothetical protein [Protaetiibacter sp. SSC-01]QNO36453.1 hypothetical protein H4J02_07875 [Protaetiibacter sp. SSC-01]